MEKTDIVLIGVGGQGSLLATKVLGEAAMRADLNIISSEVHGMAQRGGVVTSTVRIGDIYGPLIADRDAEVLLGFEPAECLRALAKVDPEKTLVIVNTREIQPFTVSLGMGTYPDVNVVLAKLEESAKKLIKLDAEQVARDNSIPVIASNIIMLGVLCGTGAVPIPKEVLLETILDNVPEKVRDKNKLAFDLGFEFGSQA